MMNIESHLLLENSRKNWNEVIDFVGTDEERFAQLVDLFFTGEMRLVQRASQPLSSIAEKHPHLVKPYLAQMVAYLKSNPIDAVKRNTMRIFQFIEIPDELDGDLFEIGMRYLADVVEPIAVKAFTMTVLRKICQKYPELASELIFQIEILVKENVSAGITNRGQHELKKLHKILAQT